MPPRSFITLPKASTNFGCCCSSRPTGPLNCNWGEVKSGLRLYIQRVLIMDHCEEMLPSYLRFVKGVVDCSDLPLNISREMLQHNPLLEKIQQQPGPRMLEAARRDEDHE